MKPALEVDVEALESSERRLNEIIDALRAIPEASDRLRDLWVEIYANAVKDRLRAIELYNSVRSHRDSTDFHMMIGQTAAKYLERMTRANEQLIRLAELAAAAQKSDDGFDPDGVFDRIGKLSPKGYA